MQSKFAVKDSRLVFAIITVALVWGTTFLGIRIAVETIPAWYVAGFRQLIASFLMLIFLIYNGQFKWIGWKNLRIQIILSLLMLIVANGLTTVAEEQLSSSLASLISSTSPLFVFIFSMFLGIEKFSFKSLAGLLLGFGGVALIFKDGISDLMNPDYRLGVVFIFIAVIGWAMGSVFTKKLNLQNQNISLNLFYQFLFAGIVQSIFGLIINDMPKFSEWSLRSILAMVYLGAFGSVAAYFAFHYALKKIAPTKVSYLSYVNTIIAIILGWLVLNEKISPVFILAATMIISGVFITNYKSGMLQKKS